jgi:hypothetical protein
VIIKNKVEFDKLFTDFSDAVKEKKYAKMSYQTWNKIKNNLCALGEKDFVEIKNDADSIRVQFHICGHVSEFIFSWDDCTFGNFLYDKFFAKVVKTEIGIRDTLEEKPYNWKADYMQSSPVDSGEWWGEVDKPLKLTYVGGDLCLKASEDEYVKINPSPLDDWKGITITAGDCVQSKACSIDIPGYATVEDVSDAIATKADKEDVNTIYDIIDEIKQTAGVGLFDNKKGKNDMKNVFNFDFGPVESECIRMSMYGLAVKNIDGVFVSYDAAAGRLVDVDILNFNGNKFLYKMPVAIKDVKVGDIIVHMRRPVFVTDVQKNSITAVDPHDGEMKTVLLTRSPFGFDFATKVVNFLGDFSAATPDNPFGNTWMFMMMDGDNKDNMLPLMMMMGQGNANMNPMMMYMMMQDKGDMKDVLPFMMMMGQNPFAVPAPISAPAVAQ